VEASLEVELAGDSLQVLSGLVTVEVSGATIERHDIGRASLRADFEEGEADFEVSAEVDSASVSAHGVVRLFAEAPEYDVSVSVADAQTLVPAAWTVPSAVAVEARVSGAGVTFARAQSEGRMEVVTTPFDDNISPGRLILEGTASGGEAEITAVGDLLGGSVDAAIRLFFDEVLRYRTDRARFENLDLTALGGPGGASSLTGQLLFSGSGLTAESAVIDLELSLDSSRYGLMDVSRLDLGAHVENGAIAAGLTGSSPAGVLELELGGLWVAGDSRIRIEEGRVAGLDLGVLLGRAGLETDIGATLRGELTPDRDHPFRADLLIELEPSRVNRWPIQSGRLDVQLEDGVLGAAGSLEGDPGELSFRGGGLPFAFRPEYRIDEAEWSGVDLGTLRAVGGVEIGGKTIGVEIGGVETAGIQTALIQTAGVQPDVIHTELRGTLVAELTGYPLDVATGSASVQLDRSSIHDEVLDRAWAELVLNLGTFQLVAGASGEDGGLDLTLVADGSVSGDEPMAHVTARLQAEHMDHLLGRASLDGGFSVEAEVDARGLDLSNAVVTARLEGRGHWLEATVDSLHVELDLAGGVLRVDTLDLRGSVGTASASGRLALIPNAADVENDFTLIAHLAGTTSLSGILADTLTTTTGDLTASITGTAANREVEISLIAAGAGYGATTAAELDLGARAALDGHWRVSEGSARMSAGGIRVGAVDVRSLEASMTLRGDTARIEAHPVVDDRRDVFAQALIVKDRDRAQVVLERLDARLDESLWQLEQPATVILADSVSVSGFRLHPGDATSASLTIEGVVGGTGAQNFDAQLEGLRLHGVSDLFGLPGLDGEGAATLSIRGTAGAPQVTGSVMATLDSAGVVVGRVDVQGEYRDSVVVLD